MKFEAGYIYNFKGEKEPREMRATIEAKDLKHAHSIIKNRCTKCKTVLQSIEYCEPVNNKVLLKPLTAIYKGARDGESYDRFTFNRLYEYVSPLDEAYIVARNDEGDLVEMPSIDFDFID